MVGLRVRLIVPMQTHPKSMDATRQRDLHKPLQRLHRESGAELLNRLLDTMLADC